MLLLKSKILLGCIRRIATAYVVFQNIIGSQASLPAAPPTSAAPARLWNHVEPGPGRGIKRPVQP
jgi:hypothetical protein